MAVLGDETRDPPPAEPGAQTIDQAVELGSIFVRSKTFMRIKADLLIGTRLGDENREPCQIEAETRIDLVAEGDEPLHEQRADRLRIADGMRGTGGDALDSAVGAEQRKLEPPRAVAACRQRRLKSCREPLDGSKHILLAHDRLVKIALGHIGRDWKQRGKWLVLAAEGAVE